MTYQTTTRVNRSPAATSPSRGWLTAVLRPAGTLDNASTAALGALLADLSAAADMVVVDLDATRIPDLDAFVDALRPAAARLAGPGTCLLVVNAPTALEHALQLVDVPAATLAADTVLTPADWPAQTKAARSQAEESSAPVARTAGPEALSRRR
jgi:hypothetical protein